MENEDGEYEAVTKRYKAEFTIQAFSLDGLQDELGVDEELTDPPNISIINQQLYSTESLYYKDLSLYDEGEI